MYKLSLLILIVAGLFSCLANNSNATTSTDPGSKAPVANHHAQKVLDSLGIVLPVITPPTANYVHVTQAGKLLFLAGSGPRDDAGKLITGRLGEDMTVEEGYAAARRVGIRQIAVLKSHLGDLSKVKQILKVKGMVNATADFTNHPEVINGYSDLMVEVFGPAGKHARAAVGMGSLPRGLCVEIEMIVETW